jgi:hypothetical protein
MENDNKYKIIEETNVFRAHGEHIQSFVNSNAFHDGAISGGYPFYSMVIIPPSTLIEEVHVINFDTSLNWNMI